MINMKEIDKNKQIEIEAAAFRRLVEHLRAHTEVQNIDPVSYTHLTLPTILLV